MNKFFKSVFLLLAMLSAQADQLFCMRQPNYNFDDSAWARIARAMVCYGPGTWVAYKMIKGDSLSEKETACVCGTLWLSTFLVEDACYCYDELVESKEALQNAEAHVADERTENENYFFWLEESRDRKSQLQEKIQNFKKARFAAFSITIPYLIGGAVWCGRYLAARRELVTKH